MLALVFWGYVLVWGFSLPGAVHVVFGSLFAILSMGALVAAYLRLVPWKFCWIPAALALAYRLMIFDLTHLSSLAAPVTLVRELATLCLLAGLCFLPSMICSNTAGT